VHPPDLLDAAERRDDARAQAASKNFCGSPVSARTRNSVITDACSMRCLGVNRVT
jgi:hypothetical protein